MHHPDATMQCRALILRTIVPLAALTVGCSSSGPDTPSPNEAVASVGQRIVNGTPSTTSDDYVVRINIGNGGLCTGTLITPNLVITARHCVSNMDETTECGTFTSNLTPSTLTISLGVNAGTNAVARGTKLFTDTGAGSNSGCSHDLALIQLDRDVPGAKIAKVRLYKLTVGETARTVGYGESGNGNLTNGRYVKTGIKVDSVGPSAYTYKTKANQAIPVSLPAGEIVTGESTCFGDSGGPLFDGSDNVIGVTSRGVDESCIDRPSIYSDTASHAALIKSAAEAAGHPITEAPAPATTPNPNDSKPSTDTTNGSDNGSTSTGTNKRPSSSSGGSSDEEEEDGTTTPAKKNRSVPITSAGCSASASTSPTGGGAPVAIVLLGLGLSMAAARRRKTGA